MVRGLVRGLVRTPGRLRGRPEGPQGGLRGIKEGRLHFRGGVSAGLGALPPRFGAPLIPPRGASGAILKMSKIQFSS